MLHKVAGKKLGRDTNQRKALFRSLANSFILHEKIVTTEPKAKAVRPMIEKLVTRAKNNSIHSRRLLLKELVSENTVRKMLEVIGPAFKERPGGYTRIVKIGARAGDQASMVSLSFVEDFAISPVKKVKEKETKKEDKQETKAELSKETKVEKKTTRAKKAVKEKDGKEETK